MGGSDAGQVGSVEISTVFELSVAQWAVLGGQEGGSLFDTKSLNNLLMCYGLSFVSIRHA